MKKIIFIILMLICINVEAKEYTGNAIWLSEYVSDTYIKLIDSNGVVHNKQARFYRRSHDNQFVYCLQPYVNINNNYIYTVYEKDYLSVLNLSEEQLNRVILLAYYGYGYDNHTSTKWYAITQMLIWKTVEPTSTIYFSTSKYGDFDYNKYVNEVNELENLLVLHNTKPNILEKEILLGESIRVNDVNNVLDGFNLISKNAKKEGNDIILEGNSLGQQTIEFVKNDTLLNEVPLVYFSPNSQNVLRVGTYFPVYYNYTYNVVAPKIRVTKQDENGNIIKQSIKFKLFNLTTNQYICPNQDCEYETKDGYFVTDYLEVGEYQIEEVNQEIKGYMWNGEPLKFSINKDTTFANTLYGEVLDLVFVNKEIVGHLKIIKKDIITGEFLSDTRFSIYNEEDKLVYSGITNADGVLIIDNLVYGKYYIKEIEAKEGYAITDEIFPFEIKENNQLVTLEITNQETIKEIPDTFLNNTYYISFILCGGLIYFVKKYI